MADAPTREQVAQAIHAKYCFYDGDDRCSGPTWDEGDLADVLMPLIRAAQAEALEAVARRWQVNGWADVLLPASKPPAIPSIDYAQRVTDWLRAQAAQMEDK